MQFEIAVIGLIQAVVVALIAGLFARESKKKGKALEKAEVRAVLRAEESLLAIKLMSASVNLGIATGIAIKNNRINGEMNAAIEEATKAEEAYQNFMNGLAARKIADDEQ